MQRPIEKGFIELPLIAISAVLSLATLRAVCAAEWSCTFLLAFCLLLIVSLLVVERLLQLPAAERKLAFYVIAALLLRFFNRRK
jgi:hypothetical protein